MPSDDLRPEHRHALEVASTFVDRISATDLARPTPCAGWDLEQLLEHMVGQHHGFARVVRDGAAASDAYAPVAFTPESWRASVDELLAAFSAADLAARVVEVELDPVRPLPITVLVGAQYLDTVIHTWDVASALGARYEPPTDVAEAMLAMASRIPDGEGRTVPGAAFAPRVALDGPPWPEALALLGRDPDWSAPG